MAELETSQPDTEEEADSETPTGSEPPKELSPNAERLQSLKVKVTCPRCQEIYSETSRVPKLLPCLHHICKQCLDDVIHPSSPKPSEAEKTTRGDRDESAPSTPTPTPASSYSLTCPTCNNVSHSRGSTSKAYQTSLIAYELVDLHHVLGKCSQDEIFCEKCTESEAVEYCYSCAQFACEFCCQIHQRWQEYSSHTIVPVRALLWSLKDFRLPEAKKVFCLTHHQNLKVYCNTCREIICNDCTVRPHQGHDFDLITDETVVAHKDRFEEALKSLSEHALVLENESENVKSQIDCISDRVTKVNADIASAFEQVQEALDSRKKELVAHLEEVANVPQTRLREHADYLQSLQDQVTTCREFLGECLRSNSATGLLSVEQTVSRHIETIGQQVKAVPSLNEDLAIRFQSRKALVRLASCFGQVRCHDNSLAKETSSLSRERGTSITSPPSGHAWESLPSQVLHPFCRSLYMNSQHLYVSSSFELSSSLSLSQDEFEMSSSSAHPSILDSTDTSVSLRTVSSEPQAPKFFGIAVRTIEGVDRPSGIALSNHIIITDFSQQQVSIFDFHGQKLRNFGTSGSRKGQFMYPHSVALDRDGKMLVTDVNYRIQMLTPNGRFTRSIGSKGSGHLQFRDPTGVAIGPSTSKVYVSERGNHRIHVLKSDLSFLSIIGKRGHGPGEFNYPSGLAVDAQGYLYVADTYNHRVQIFTEDGNFVTMFGQKGKEPGQFHSPSNVCVDLDGFVYVSEIINNRISVFRSNGEFVLALGSKGKGLGQLMEPRGVAMDANRVLYVCDFGNNRIQLFK